jgi:hypothetical protein
MSTVVAAARLAGNEYTFPSITDSTFDQVEIINALVPDGALSYGPIPMKLEIIGP